MPSKTVSSKYGTAIGEVELKHAVFDIYKNTRVDLFASPLSNLMEKILHSMNHTMV